MDGSLSLEYAGAKLIVLQTKNYYGEKYTALSSKSFNFGNVGKTTSLIQPPTTQALAS